MQLVNLEKVVEYCVVEGWDTLHDRPVLLVEKPLAHPDQQEHAGLEHRQSALEPPRPPIVTKDSRDTPTEPGPVGGSAIDQALPLLPETMTCLVGALPISSVPLLLQKLCGSLGKDILADGLVDVLWALTLIVDPLYGLLQALIVHCSDCIESSFRNSIYETPELDGTHEIHHLLNQSAKWLVRGHMTLTEREDVASCDLWRA